MLDCLKIYLILDLLPKLNKYHRYDGSPINLNKNKKFWIVITTSNSTIIWVVTKILVSKLRCSRYKVGYGNFYLFLINL